MSTVQADSSHESAQQPIELLKIIALLLDYPSQNLYDYQDELFENIQASRYVSPAMRSGLCELLKSITQQNLLDVQEIYDGLFDRGRSLSLYLFEHIHGESRDRGQAMVDLIDQYQLAGFELNAKELPDYLPLFLEFLSVQSALEAKQQLADIEQILALLGARLKERDSQYLACFSALLQIAGSDVDESLTVAQEKVGNEEEADSLEALDREWEEEAVSFMDNATTPGCSPTRGQVGNNAQKVGQTEVPIHWLDFQDTQTKPNSNQGA